MFTSHIDSIRILMEQIPQISSFQPRTKEIMVENCWVAVKYLRGAVRTMGKDNGTQYKVKMTLFKLS
jgi:hypothetical protein